MFFFFFFLVWVSFYSRGLQLLKGATQCSLLSLKKRMKPGTEWERPADKAAKHYGNGVAEFLRCTHTHTCSHTHKQDKAQTLKSVPGHIIMRWCIWLAAAQNNGPDPRHLCGGPADHQRADHNASGVLECPPLAVPGQKQGQVHQQAAPDWLSRTQKAAGGKEPFSLAAAASFCWWMGVWEDGTGTTGSTGRVWGNHANYLRISLCICRELLSVTRPLTWALWNSTNHAQITPHSDNRSFALILY